MYPFSVLKTINGKYSILKSTGRIEASKVIFIEHKHMQRNAIQTLSSRNIKNWTSHSPICDHLSSFQTCRHKRPIFLSTCQQLQVTTNQQLKF